MLLLHAYFGSWRPQDINRLPIRLTAPMRSIDDLHSRAIELVHAETSFRGSNADWLLLGELALVITAAASRANHLELRASERLAVEVDRPGAR
jgi:hypothetical protein